MMVQPASIIFARPPARIRSRISRSPFSGKHTRASPVSGRHSATRSMPGYTVRCPWQKAWLPGTNIHDLDLGNGVVPVGGNVLQGQAERTRLPRGQGCGAEIDHVGVDTATGAAG